MSANTRTHPLRLVFAAVQPIVFGWAIIVVAGIFAYTLMADSPALGSTTWQDVASVATGWWLTAFGGTLHFDGVSITLPPLLITVLTYLAALGFIRKLPVKDWVDIAILALSSGVATALLGLLAPLGSNWWPAGIGGAIVSIFAVLSSKNRVDWFGKGIFTSAAGRAVYDGFMLGRRAVLLALLFACAALLTATIAGWSQILKINGYYIVEWHSNAMMWLFQLAYLPVYVLWALAYIIGAGFSVGVSTTFSALGVSAAPLPAIPILGALPQPGDGAPWVIAVVVIALIALGIRQARAFPVLPEVLITGGIQVLIVALFGSVLALVSRGAIGPDRLSEAGADALRMAFASALVIGLPMLVGMILGHRSATAKYREWFGAAKTRVEDWRQRRIKPATHESSPGALSSDSPQSEPVAAAGTAKNTQSDNGPTSAADTATSTAVTAQTAPDSEEDR